MVLAGTGSGSERWYTDAFHQHSRELAQQFERDGSPAVARTYGRSPSRIPFEIKDARGFAEFSRMLSEHDAQGSAHTARGFQGARPSLYDFESDIRRLTTPALIVVGDEDDRCIEPSLFLKDAIPASGLVMLPQTGHVVNLEEPDLFNRVLCDFLPCVDAGASRATVGVAVPPAGLGAFASVCPPHAVCVAAAARTRTAARGRRVVWIMVPPAVVPSMNGGGGGALHQGRTVGARPGSRQSPRPRFLRQCDAIAGG